MVLIYLQSIPSVKNINIPFRITILDEEEDKISNLNFRPGVSSSLKTYEAQNLDRLEIITAPPFCDIADELIELFETKQLVFSDAFQFKMMKSQFKSIGYNFNIKPIYLSFTTEKNKLNNIEQYLQKKQDFNLQSILYAKNYVGLMHHVIDNKVEILNNDNIRLDEKSFLNFSRYYSAAGVYFFLNDLQDVIYVGKAKNVKKRLQSHFSKSTKDGNIDYKQVKDINVEYTGNEIIAELIESENIKKLKPIFNTHQISNALPFLINRGKTASGIYKLKIIRKECEDNMRERYFNRNSVKKSLELFCNVYDLCRKHCGIETVKGPCSKVSLKGEICVCNGKELINDYNIRFELAFDVFKSRRSKKIYKLRGRSIDEDGFIYMVNNIYEGYGFIQRDEVIYSFNDILGHLNQRSNNYDTSRIVDQLCKKVPQEKILELF